MESYELFGRLLDAANTTLDFEGAQLLNATNATADWLTLEGVEHFLGDPAVLHATALVLGLVAILLSKRFPLVLAAVASCSFGLWTGLVVQDRQIYEQPLYGWELPEGAWVPICAGLLAAASVAALTGLVWRLSLAMLTGGILMLLSVAFCRLVNVSPKRILKVGSSMLSMYRIVGAVVLVVTVLGAALLTKKFHKAMLSFASAHLGTLLLLSGISYFAQEAGGVEAPFSLLDDLARIFSEVRSGRCHLWENQEGESTENHLEGCDCGESCQTEIVAWIVSSWVVLGSRLVIKWQDRRKKERAKEATAEEKVSLKSETSFNKEGEPSAETIGAGRA